jgi:hypothetical protein
MGNHIVWLWQLPQHLLGLLLIQLLSAKKQSVQKPDGYVVQYWEYEPDNRFSKFLSGVSLGEYILLPARSVNENTILHEHGHSKQSLFFGFLYLFVIGIPSVINNLWDRLFHKDWSAEKRKLWYYSRYPEKQADKLGGVKR